MRGVVRNLLGVKTEMRQVLLSIAAIASRNGFAPFSEHANFSKAKRFVVLVRARLIQKSGNSCW